MPFPIRHLPVIQNWDCHLCGHCCTDYWVPVTDEERKRIEEQAWDKLPEFQGKPLFVKYGKWWARKYRLNHRNGDHCIFLSDEGRCRIHEKFGAQAKPFACQLYPYVLVPVGDHWRVSLRFACPSAAANKGRPVSGQLPMIREMAEEFERWRVSSGRTLPAIDQLPPPRMHGSERVGWDDLLQFVRALVALLSDRNDPFWRRMLKCLALARICKQSKFDKVTGPRLRDFLQLLQTVVDAEVPRDLTRLPPPGWIGRILFRVALSFYIRRDQGSRRGVSRHGRLALLRPAWRFLRGTGPIPELQRGLPDKKFEDIETPLGSLPPEAQEILERYYLVKVESLQFCGSTNFGIPFWEGFESMALTLPIILWLTRGYRELEPCDAVCRAITITDEHFTFHPFLASFRHRLGMWIMAFRQELDRLITWYSR